MNSETLSRARQRLVLAAAISGLLLAMLDQTIVGTALPAIVTALGGSSLYVWVITGYLVPATVALPVYARLSDRYGRRAMLLVGMGLFLAGSALSATAQTVEELIAWRALQGAGAGALEGLTFILVADLFRGQRSAALQGALAGVMGLSFIAGPLIGGLLTDQVGWRSVFLVNLPIGAAAFLAVATCLPASIGRSERGVPLDLAGIATLTGAVGLVLVGLSNRANAEASGGLDAWTQASTGGLLVAGLALTAIFVLVERRAVAPIVPLGLFTDRRTAALLTAGATATFGLFACVLLLPRYLQTVRDVSATHSGLLIYPLLLGVLVSVNLGAIAIAKTLALRRVLLGACLLAALGALGFATFGADTPDWQSLLFMALLGVGIGPALSGLQIAMQRTVAPAQIAGALGTLMLVRQVGGSLALATASTVYAARLSGGDAASATGAGVFAVALGGTVLAAVALIALPRSCARLPALPAPAPA